MKCPYCNAEINNNNVFCHTCGQNIKAPRRISTPYLNPKQTNQLYRVQPRIIQQQIKSTPIWISLLIKAGLLIILGIIFLSHYKFISFTKETQVYDEPNFMQTLDIISTETIYYIKVSDKYLLTIETQTSIYRATATEKEFEAIQMLIKLNTDIKLQKMSLAPIFIYIIIAAVILFFPRLLKKTIYTQVPQNY